MSEINNLPPQSRGKIEAKPTIQAKPLEEDLSCKGSICDCPKCDIKPGLGVLGQSQVKRPENVATDTEFFMKNPEIVAICDEYFEKTLEKLTADKDPQAYENACVLTDAFAKEFASAN